MRAGTALFLALFLPLPAVYAADSANSSIDARIRRLLARSPVAREAFVGIVVEDDHGRRIFALNADRAFIPASNTKLFSVALAFQRLGPAKQFETRVEQRGNDLVLIGTGDANLSGRVLPYQPSSQPQPALTVMDDLAAQVLAHGIHEVSGDIVGDDSAFLYQPFAPGWSIEDALNGDGAPVSALMVSDNAVRVEIAPTIGGAAAAISFDPPVLPFAITSTVTTGTVTDIHSQRFPYEPRWTIRGTIRDGDPAVVEHWPVDDPAQFAASALQYSLEQHGVHVRGVARAVHHEEDVPFIPAAPGVVVAQHQSLPLIEDLRLTNKISQNAHADLLLFDVAASRAEGLKQLDAFLAEAGIPEDSYRFFDGSGLSRLNLVTPAAVVRLLEFMAHSQYAAEWMSTLPISGVDGSLADRLGDRKLKGRVHAKTGSLLHTSALSGYADPRHGRKLVFSIFINNAFAATAAQRELIDKICAALVN